MRFDLFEEGIHMDSIRSIFGVGVAQLVVLGALVPAYADAEERDDDQRRHFGRRSSQTVSHNREDYPVITNWLTSPDTPEASDDAK
jgi:hypothetical protein